LESPVFRLEGVVKAKNEMTDFEGPLTLILQLLSKDKIEIRDISISIILEQYLKYLDEMAELDLNIASEFVAMASHLAYIKTRMLLSGDEEVSELEELITSLEKLHQGDIYLQIKDAAQTLSGMYSKGGAMMAGPPEYLPQEEFTYIHISDDLLNAIFSMINKENSIIGSLNPRQAVYPQKIIYSIPEKISQLLDRLKNSTTILVTELFYESGSRTEVIATLIAVLELCKVGSVLLTGERDGMKLTYTGTGRDIIAADFTEEGIVDGSS